MRQPVILGDFAQYEHLSEEYQQQIFEQARYHGLDNSVYPFCIGGSDVAPLYGESPWQTPLDLYCSKMHVPTMEREKNEDALEAGHRAEPYILETFTRQTGFPGKRNTLQARHPAYEHCVANVDGFCAVTEPELNRLIADGTVRRVDGSKDPVSLNGDTILGLEFKTTTPDNFTAVRDWKSGLLPTYYNLQVQFYMEVWDIDFWIVVAQWGFRRADSVILLVDRDRTVGRSIMEDAEDFVAASLAGHQPSPFSTKNAALVVKTMESLYGPPDLQLPPIALTSAREGVARKLLELQLEKATLQTQINDLSGKVRALDKEMIRYAGPIIEDLQTATAGTISVDGKLVKVSFAPSGRINVDSRKLMNLYPDVYKEVTSPSATRTLKISELA